MSGFTQNAANNAVITIVPATRSPRALMAAAHLDAGNRRARPFAKLGTGTETLTGVNTYTGDTSVLNGTLSITNAYLAIGADVFMATGGIFDLNFPGTNTIDQLFLNNVSQGPGVYGSLTSGAQFPVAYITGTGTLTVSAPGSGSGSLLGGSVPEPATVSFVFIGLAAFGLGGASAERKTTRTAK